MGKDRILTHSRFRNEGIKAEAEELTCSMATQGWVVEWDTGPSCPQIFDEQQTVLSSSAQEEEDTT